MRASLLRMGWPRIWRYWVGKPNRIHKFLCCGLSQGEEKITWRMLKFGCKGIIGFWSMKLPSGSIWGPIFGSEYHILSMQNCYRLVLYCNSNKIWIEREIRPPWTMVNHIQLGGRWSAINWSGYGHLGNPNRGGQMRLLVMATPVVGWPATMFFNFKV